MILLAGIIGFIFGCSVTKKWGLHRLSYMNKKFLECKRFADNLHRENMMLQGRVSTMGDFTKIDVPEKLRNVGVISPKHIHEALMDLAEHD